MKRLYILPLFLVISVLTHAQCWKTVAAGYDHTLGIRQDGTLWAWGFNADGRLGDGTTTNRLESVQIGTDTWKAVSAGPTHSLGIKTDGTLWAWGDNLFGSIGDGSYGDYKTTPVQVGKATDWKTLATSQWCSFALKADGTLWAWGYNFDGQLGNGGAPAFIPSKIGTSSNWKQLAAGGNHVLAIQTDGSLWSWGANSDGELGNGTKNGMTTPQRVGSGANWSMVSAGYNHSIALQTDGTLWCWGNNDDGQLGNGGFTPSSVPIKIGTSNWLYVATGELNSHGIKTDGTLWEWGASNNANTPAQLGSANNWQLLVSGKRHSLGFTTDNILWAWGDGDYGKLGNGIDAPQTLPVIISTSAPIGDVIQYFCKSGKLSDIKITGAGVKWYASPTSTSALPETTSIVDGVYYYASQTLQTCESSSRLPVRTLINITTTAPPTGLNSQYFCDDAKVSDLAVDQSNYIQWYAQATGGLPFASSTLLVNGNHYFATQTIKGCESEVRLDVKATVNDTPTPEGEEYQYFCSVNTTTSNIIATGESIQWYDVEIGGAVLPPNQPLTSGKNYFATQTINGFESCSRLRVNVTLATPPQAPNGINVQYFCNTGSVTNLTASGDNIKWYLSEKSGTPLVPSTGLSTNTYYYASQSSQWCESTTRLEVKVVLNTVATPAPTGASSQLLCKGLPLSNLAVSGTAITWYHDNAQVPDTTEPLNGHYFASQTIDGCESVNRLDVSVSIVENNVQPPALPTTTVGWYKVETTEYFTVAIREDRTLWYWGKDYNGKTVNAKQVSTFNDWASISIGRSFALGLREDGTMWGWGYNYDGQLNDGTRNFQSTPVQCGSDTDWKAVSAGDYFSLALKKDGTLWSWGDNYYGVIGFGSTAPTFKLLPNQIGFDTDWTNIWTSGYTSFAQKNDGSLWLWGATNQVLLGDSSIEKYIPTKVGTSKDWAYISVTNGFIVAIKKDGSLWGWGNLYLGDGKYQQTKYEPTQIGSEKNWKSVSAGTDYILATKKDGTLWSWGSNYGITLGNGFPIEDGASHDDIFVPTQIGTDTNWETVFAGYYQSFAVKTNGELWGWGYNGYGEIGDGTRKFINRPKLILANNVSFCSAATIGDLIAAGTSLKWYDSPASSNPIASLTALVSGTTYYATQTINTCESASRLPLVVSILETPETPATVLQQKFCKGTHVSDLQPAGTAVRWHESVTDETILTDSLLLKDGHHYFGSRGAGSCESGRIEVVVTLTGNSTPQPSANADQVFCDGSTIVNLKATGSEIKWYTSKTGNVELISSRRLGDGVHYFASQTVDGCESSSRQEVVPTVYTTAIPAGEVSHLFCVGGTVSDLVATGTSLVWFNTAENGTMLPPSTSLKDNAHYFASQTLNGCPSTIRFEVIAYSAGTKPGADGDAHYCDDLTVGELSFYAPAGLDYRWYDVPTGGVALTANQSVISGKHYFFAYAQHGCETTNRLDVRALIEKVPPPDGLAEQSFCEGNTVMFLTAVGKLGGIRWYDAPKGGNEISFSDFIISGKQYYAAQLSGLCSSVERLEVLATDRTAPPVGDPSQVFCEGAAVTSIVADGESIKWYDTETQGRPLTSFDLLQNGYVYYATQTLSDCESAHRLKVSVALSPVPLAPIASPAQELMSGTMLKDINIVGTDISWYSTLEDALAHVNALNDETKAVGGNTYYATQRPKSCEGPPTGIAVSVVTALESTLTQHIYPNPVDGVLYVSFDTRIERIQVEDVTGHVVITQNTKKEHEASLDMSSLKTGVYLVKINIGAEDVVIRKIIKL